MNKFYKAILFCGLLTGFTSTAVCASTELDFVIENGVIETSGGFVGDGVGRLSVTGTFTGTFTDTNVQFSNINIITNPDSAFEFPSFEGVIDTRPGFLGIVFNGIEKTAINNTYRGTLLGNSLNLEGVFDESAFDGFQFNYNINALGSPVPLPSALVLFISCFGFLKLKLKRP